jgi:hypothetical protein
VCDTQQPDARLAIVAKLGQGRKSCSEYFGCDVFGFFGVVDASSHVAQHIG